MQKWRSFLFPPLLFLASRHSSESWNPVVFTIHSRVSGNDNSIHHFGWPGAGRQGRKSFHTLGSAFLDSSLRWNDEGAGMMLLCVNERSFLFPPLLFLASRHSSESWNPVVFTIHSRVSGNDNSIHHFGWPGAGRQGRKSFHTLGSVFLDSSLRWNDEGAGMMLLCRNGDLSFFLRCYSWHPVIPAKARLHGCRWVERRQEQAAEESSGFYYTFPRKRE